MNETITGHAVHRDDEASKIGMWLFLFTELLLFGGLFLVYTIYRHLNSAAFANAAGELSVLFGTVNTVVLITSSLTVALSISAIKNNKAKRAKMLLWITLLFALIFMINKYFEWSAKIHHGLFPGMEHFMTLPPGEALFFLLYFFMTGLHALHIIAGSIFIAVVIAQLNKGKITQDDYVLQENAGLYWHLVDIIWIYLFPLFYLIH
ncbi:MAG: cytochrome c oxidase subunit 3 family protein [Bacteroidales bacterium]|nr:cytochrome c oxidase subunit 3 family protein [Bacteroidales bacterium]